MTTVEIVNKPVSKQKPVPSANSAGSNGADHTAARIGAGPGGAAVLPFCALCVLCARCEACTAGALCFRMAHMLPVSGALCIESTACHTFFMLCFALRS